MTTDDRALLAARLRKPALALAALLLLLGVDVLMGQWLPIRRTWMIEAAATTLMVGIVLIVSMEFGSEPPIIRFFAVIGFFWVAILFTMTLIDYLSR